jgi:imidazolonepropionase-like amidohydrolase
VTTAILAAEAIDPETGRLGPVTVLVDGGTVTEVRSGHDHDLGAATVLDHRGHTLLPGLIDAHVHLNLRADGRIMQTAAEPEGVLVATTVANARTALAAGITTVRDIGSKGRSTFDAREGAAASGLPLPRMLLAGPPVTITGGHCWFFGGEADGVEGVRRRVRELVRDGSDWIKVMATGGGTPGSIPWKPSYTAAELDAIVDEAHRRGVKVTAHCLSAEGMRLAVQSGVDHIEHAGFSTGDGGQSRFDPEVADRMAEAGVVVSPTLSVRLFMRDHQIAIGAGTDSIDAWQRRFDNGMQQFAALVRAGVRFAAGTDAGWHLSPFDGLAEEIACIAECGPSTVDALRSATSATAEHFGLAGHGRLTSGAPADLLVVDGDPLADARALRRVERVLREGTVVS